MLDLSDDEQCRYHLRPPGVAASDALAARSYATTVMTQQRPTQRYVLVFVVAFLLFSIVAGISLYRHDERHLPEIDELYWIGSAYYFDLAFVRGEWGHSDWQLLPARENPPFGKYLIGAALYAGGVRVTSPEKLGGFYFVFRDRGWGQQIESRAKRQAVVDRVSPEAQQAMGAGIYQALSPSELRIGRALMAVFGFLCALGIVSIGRATSGIISGVLSGVAFVLHPIVIEAYTRISVDIIALFFSILTVRLLLAILPTAWDGAEISRGRATMLAIATTGTLVAACGSKMNALIVVALTISVCLAVCVKAIVSGERPWRRSAWSLGLALVFAPLVFVALDPTLHPDITSGCRALVEEHRLTALLQREFLLTETWLRPGLARAAAVSKLVGMREGMFLIILGTAFWQSVDGLRRFSFNTVICLWWWIALVLVVWWIPFAWGRYALPVLPPGLLLLSKSLVQFAGAIRNLFRRPSTA
jgi:hypothetical protein